MSKLKDLYNRFNEKYPTLFEVARFVITGGIATIIDMLVMGVVLYCFNPSLYPKFYNVWIGKIGEPSTLATVIGTGLGFTVSLIFNYLLSVFFVYRDRGNSQTAKGRVVFVILSVIGLGINMLGMWFGRDVCHINEWITKIIMTLIVLVYNYLSRKFIIFKKSKEGSAAPAASEPAAGETANPETQTEAQPETDTQTETEIETPTVVQAESEVQTEAETKPQTAE